MPQIPWQRPSEALYFLFWAAVFGIAYTQAPLYYSNQNQYFLHGVAAAGEGFLERDWLANTADPTPVFSAGVMVTYRYLHESLFHLYYVLLQGLYFYSLVGIATVLTGIAPRSLAGLCFMAILVVAHSGLARLISARLMGIDYPWYLQCGLAGQYILGFGLQPSVFGVFLLASIHAFLRARCWQATVWASASAVVHTTYLPGAAMLVLSYMIVVARVGSLRRALGLGFLSLALVAPIVIYNYVFFAPSSRAEFAEAQEILARFRIPHHAIVERWLDGIAIGQIVWMILAIILCWGNALFTVMLTAFVCSLVLTLVQVITDSNTLALLFPWRISGVLVPVATAVIGGRLISRLDGWFAGRPARQARVLWVGCGLVLLCATAGGAAIMFLGLGYRSNAGELPLLNFVRANRQEGDTYLLPVSIPKIGAGPRGAFSTNFTPAPRPGTHLIAIDLQRFRICTGAPIYVDFKSIPYRDVEVIEWKRRLLWNQSLYAGSASKQDLRSRGITHVVATTDQDMVPGEKIYEDAGFRLYRLLP
jgi:hypothetical protein